MATMVRALVVEISGDAVVCNVMDDLDDSLRAAIGGGWLEGVSPRGDAGWHAYCDEEGKLKGLPMNVAATALAHELGWPHGDVLCGSVIFLGDEGPTGDGEEKDLPEVVLETARRLGLAYQESSSGEGSTT